MKPIDFIKKNFLPNLNNFSNFYFYPILHPKDVLWNDMICELFVKKVIETKKIETTHTLMGLMILIDLFWLLDNQYEKIQKRKYREKNFNRHLTIFGYFFSKTQYSKLWLSDFINFGKKKKKGTSRKKTKKYFTFLGCLSKRKKFPF